MISKSAVQLSKNHQNQGFLLHNTGGTNGRTVFTAWQGGFHMWRLQKFHIFYPLPPVTVTNQLILFLLSTFKGPPLHPLTAVVIYGIHLRWFPWKLSPTYSLHFSNLGLLEGLGSRPQDLVHGLHVGGSRSRRDEGVAAHVAPLGNGHGLVRNKYSKVSPMRHHVYFEICFMLHYQAVRIIFRLFGNPWRIFQWRAFQKTKKLSNSFSLLRHLKSSDQDFFFWT